MLSNWLAVRRRVYQKRPKKYPTKRRRPRRLKLLVYSLVKVQDSFWISFTKIANLRLSMRPKTKRSHRSFLKFYRSVMRSAESQNVQKERAT